MGYVIRKLVLFDNFAEERHREDKDSRCYSKIIT